MDVIGSAAERSETSERTPAYGRLGLLAAILLCFLCLKLDYNPPPVGHGRTDATFYYQVARHVADGDGIRTSVSLYHQGLRDMPSPTNIYPLWPLVLAGAGHIIGLERAASVVPEVLYLVSLLLTYLLGSHVAESMGARSLVRIRGVPVLDAGHLTALLFGVNTVFFRTSSICMTEPLCFSLALASLLALAAAARNGSLAWGGVAGVLAGLSFLARSQFLGLPLAITATLLLGGTVRRTLLRSALAAMCGAVLVILPWALFLLCCLQDFQPRMLLDFSSYRETPEIPRFAGFVEYASGLEHLVDFIGSFGVAFSPNQKYSYVRSFGWTVYLLPLAMLVGLLVLARSRRRLGETLLQERSLLPLGTTLVGLVALLPVHGMHATWPIEWWFHHRHGLPIIFLLIPAIGLLVAERWPLRIACVLLVASTFQVNGPKAMLRDMPPAAQWPAEPELFAWLNGHKEPPVGVSTVCRELALWSKGTYHWIRCGSSVAEVRSLFEHLDVDYLILYPIDEPCRFQAVRRELEPVRSFGPPGRQIQVLRWRAGHHPPRERGVGETSG